MCFAACCSRIGAAIIGINMLFALGLVHGAEFSTRLREPGHYRINDR